AGCECNRALHHPRARAPRTALPALPQDRGVAAQRSNCLRAAGRASSEISRGRVTRELRYESCLRLADFGGALQFVPGEGFAINSAFERLQEHGREQLAVGESLQPQMKQQLRVLALSFLAALQEKSQRRRHEINHQEDHEEKQEPLETAWV